MLDYTRGKWRRTTANIDDKPTAQVQVLAKGGQRFIPLATIAQMPDTKSPEAGRTGANARLMAGGSVMYRTLIDVMRLITPIRSKDLSEGDRSTVNAIFDAAQSAIMEVEQG